jgi:hypothetical protein
VRRTLFWVGASLLIVFAVCLTGITLSIRSSVKHFSEGAMTRFPGDRVEALIQLVDCDGCELRERNHAVWALAQMADPRALSVLTRHFGSQPCDHNARLCQKELRKAIRMVETRNRDAGRLFRILEKWRTP